MGNDGDYRKQVGIDYHPMTQASMSSLDPVRYGCI